MVCLASNWQLFCHSSTWEVQVSHCDELKLKACSRLGLLMSTNVPPPNSDRVWDRVDGSLPPLSWQCQELEEITLRQESDSNQLSMPALITFDHLSDVSSIPLRGSTWHFLALFVIIASFCFFYSYSFLYSIPIQNLQNSTFSFLSFLISFVDRGYARRVYSHGLSERVCIGANLLLHVW